MLNAKDNQTPDNQPFDHKDYDQNGFAVERQALPDDIIQKITNAIAAIIINHAHKHAQDIAQELEKMSAYDVLQGGVLLLRERDNDLVRGIVDTMQTHPVLLSFLYSDVIKDIAMKYTGATNENTLSFINPYLRLDLPSKYEEQKEKLSLPWHQESSYYEIKTACENAIVISINPFGCSQNEGCVEMAPQSHKNGKLEHKRYYKDEENKRNYRVEINPEDHGFNEHVFAESEQGDIAVFNFNLFHRSGVNNSDKVRYTLLVRASNIADSDYVV